MHVVEPAEHVLVLAFGGFDHKKSHSLIVGLVKNTADGVRLARAGASSDEDMRGEGILFKQNLGGLLTVHVEYPSETKPLVRLRSIESGDVPSECRAFDDRQTRHRLLRKIQRVGELLAGQGRGGGDRGRIDRKARMLVKQSRIQREDRMS